MSTTPSDEDAKATAPESSQEVPPDDEPDPGSETDESADTVSPDKKTWQ